MIDSCGSLHCLLGVNLISDENGITYNKLPSSNHSTFLTGQLLIIQMAHYMLQVFFLVDTSIELSKNVIRKAVFR